MKYWTNCGTALADNSKFCQNCGASTTMPPLSEISTAWPHPWLYSRVFLALAVGYVLMWIMFYLRAFLAPGGHVIWAICLLLVNMGLAQAEKISQENRQSLGQNC